jgi:hypothetical protein
MSVLNVFNVSTTFGTCLMFTVALFLDFLTMCPLTGLWNEQEKLACPILLSLLERCRWRYVLCCLLNTM